MADRMDEICKSLLAYDSATLANALEKLNLRDHDTGYTDSSISNVVNTGRICGVAVTVRMECRKTGSPELPRALMYEALAAADGPSILCIEDDDDPPGVGALCGEVMGTHLVKLGCLGVITNGTVRDLDEMKEMGLANHAAGVVVSHAYVRVTRVGGPVTIGGLRIEPGDLLHADQHGVLSIPREAAPKLPALAEEVLAMERGRIAWLNGPDFSVEELLKH